MDLSKIDFNFIEHFSSYYSLALDLFEEDPMEASPKKQKKIRKFLEGTAIKGESFPKKVEDFIAPAVEDRDFLAFFKTCYDHADQNGTYQKQLFERAAADLSKDAKEALSTLIFEQFCGGFRKRGKDAYLPLAFGGSHNRILTLINATCLPQGDFDCLSFGTSPLIRDEEGYRLIGEAANWEEDTEEPFAVRFTEAKVEISLYRADELLFGGTPWEHLSQIAADILEKWHLPGNHFNNLEKEHFPLIVELSKLSYWARIPERYQKCGFPTLKEKCVRFGYSKPLSLLERIETGMAAGQDTERLTRRLIALLNHQKYEPLWRELFTLLQTTQEGYPSRREHCCAPAALQEARALVQEQMEALGYEGQYPDFFKRGAIRRLRLAESYDISYFAGLTKRAAFHIHCTEVMTKNGFFLEFLCGAELLRKGEEPKDIYSCLFFAKGHRFFQAINYQYDIEDSDAKDLKQELPVYARVAAKKAELAPLTKQERIAIHGFDGSLSLFFPVFFLMGGLFAIFMTLGMMLLPVIFALLDGQPQAIPSMIAEIPWWALFLFCWVGFGGAMGFITVLSKRK